VRGEKETGVCVIEMMERKKGIDAGGVFASERIVSIIFMSVCAKNKLDFIVDTRGCDVCAIERQSGKKRREATRVSSS
jgi:hypothetical protein